MIYDIRIVDKVVQLIKENNINILSNVDLFEEKINTLAPNMLQECFLIVLGLKNNISTAFLPLGDFNKKHIIDIYMRENEINEDDAVFTIGMFQQLINIFKNNIQIVAFGISEDNHSLLGMKIQAKASYDGIGCVQDYIKSFQLYKNVLNEGDYTVLADLGYMSEYGLGTEEDHEKAVDYYERGALNQDDRCLYRLGLCHYIGKGCEKDERTAILYLQQSHLPEAYKKLGEIYENDGMLGESFRYYQKGANEYDEYSLYKTGMAYFEGRGTQKDYNLALKYLSYAAYFAQKDAICQLGVIILKGIGCQPDVEKGLTLINKAASLDCGNAYILLAKMHEIGQYLEKDIHKSTLYYQKAIELNDNKELEETIRRIKEHEGL